MNRLELSRITKDKNALSKAVNVLLHHKFLILMLAWSSFFLFSNLSGQYLWFDETKTALLGQNILKFGYPRAWDGKFLVAPMGNEDFLKGSYAFTLHTWLQYYVAALSLALFGANNFAAHFPFALIGLASIWQIYLLAREVSGNSTITKLATLLISTSVAFFLFARQCRYYSLGFFFSTLTLLAFLRLLKEPSWRYAALFTVASLLLFYSYWALWIIVVTAIACYFFLFVRERQSFFLLAASAAVNLLLVAPWYFYANPLGTARVAGARPPTFQLSMFFVYFWKLNVYFFPLAVLSLILLALVLLQKVRLLPKERQVIHWRKEYLLLSAVILSNLLYVSFGGSLFSNYILGTIPPASILAAFIVAKIRASSKILGVTLLVILIFTNVLHILPYVVVDRLHVVSPHVPISEFNYTPPPISFMESPQGFSFTTVSLQTYLRYLTVRFHLFDFLGELTHDYDSRIEGIVKYLREHGREDEVVLVQFLDSNSIHFYTGMKVMPLLLPHITDPEIHRLISCPYESIDWVISTGYVPADKEPYFLAHREEFEAIYIEYPNLAIDPRPHLEVHSFATVEEASGFYIYRRRSPGGEEP